MLNMTNIIKVTPCIRLWFYIKGWNYVDFSGSAHDIDLFRDSVRIFNEFRIPMYVESAEKL